MASSIFAELRAGVVTTEADQTRALAARLAAACPPGTVVALHGDLGAGKTTFTQGFARGLGIEEAVTSPTFTIFTLHRGGGRTLVHVDAYRLEHGSQLEDLMIDDFLVAPWWVVVEWPEKVADWLPATALHLDLTPSPDRSHALRLRPLPHP
jgi:tRNA threonylcarbamoyladenosine biosynthesis protein TsaE